MFSHLHLHTEYSLLNGATRIKDAVGKAKTHEMPALAITDYGNIFGAVEFFESAEQAGIKPLLGCVLFLPNYDNHKLKQYKKGEDVLWQILLLVKNEEGYKNLSRLITQSYLEGFYYKPRVDTALLKEYGQGLIALSSGFNSEINHHLYNERREEAVRAVKKYASIFSDYYIELQDNGLAGQKKTNEELVSIAKETGVPVVATNNIHYLGREDASAFEVLRDIQIGRTITSPHDQMKFSTDEYHFRSEQEMQELFAFCPEALASTQEIVGRCDYHFTYGQYYLPQYEVEPGKTLDESLTEKAAHGFNQRWDRIKTAQKLLDEDRAFYEERLKHELSVIQKMGFSGYFLIVADFINWAKQRGIPVGPGRGSGAGSLVAYALSITDIDPIPFDLLFERFLNPERISMPDFDVDFCQDRRGEVIDYVTKKYGNVSQIITFGKMKAKAVLRDVGRVMELDYDYVDKIAKMVPNALDITLTKALEQEPDLKALYEKEDTVRRLVDVSLRLEGLSRHASVHAAGVIITDKPLWHFSPLYKGSKEDIVLQFDMKSAEKIGLIKFDFLGLKTLTVIKKTIDNIKRSCGVEVDITDIPMNDETVLKSLGEGDGCGIFQLESSGMRELMKKLKPGCFEDIIALVALYRPGPLESGMVDDFIERKWGRKEIVYSFPQLEKILKGTYGVIVYQEQVMKIASELANYSLGEADILRRAMGKKKVKEMDAQKKRFLDGAKQNNLDLKKAENVFDLMAKFAGYGFNKSHSAAYAMVSYQTAWLKTHYPAEYMAAILSTEINDTDKIFIFIDDCKHHNIKLLPPDINLSEIDFTVEKSGFIRYGLAALKGVGSSAIDSIITARESGGVFKSLYDFCVRVDLSRVTRKVIDVLIKAGAFDDFSMTKKAMCELAPQIVDLAVTRQKDERQGQGDLFSGMDTTKESPVGLSVKDEGEWSKNEILKFEKEVFGFYFSGHPLEAYADHLKAVTTHSIRDLSRLSKDTPVTVGGTILSHRVIVTKKGQKMAFGFLEDLYGKVEVVVFARAFKACEGKLAVDQPLIIKGIVDHGSEGDKIVVEEIEILSERIKQATRSIHLEIPYKKFTGDKVQSFMDIIKHYKGDSLVFFHLKEEHFFETVIALPAEHSVIACEPLQHRINELFDHKAVRFV
ncbi:MAG: DNA polymerase III subunit alpha [Deltaproteobacteria bacterium]|nr:DNA polymerase III subunit alpha [Deltaproteobacteria bacterium]